MVESRASDLRGLPVILPDGRLLGTVHDAVVDVTGWDCTHIFVCDPPEEIVQDRVHIAIPWRWVRSIADVVLLRWFPATPIPRDP